MTDIIRLMREWLDIVAIGPADAWSGIVAEDVVIRLPYAPPGIANELRGRDRALDVLAGSWKAKKSIAWHDVVIRRTEDPDLLVTTARSEFLLASGRLYANTYVMLTRFRDGKVAEHAEYFNPVLVMEAYGPGPK
jgi:ketosteroid isomerase-like protein